VLFLFLLLFKIKHIFIYYIKCELISLNILIGNKRANFNSNFKTTWHRVVSQRQVVPYTLYHCHIWGYPGCSDVSSGRDYHLVMFLHTPVRTQKASRRPGNLQETTLSHALNWINIWSFRL